MAGKCTVELVDGKWRIKMENGEYWKPVYATRQKALNALFNSHRVKIKEFKREEGAAKGNG